MIVRALTLWRPWPNAILDGPKDIENRPRRWTIPKEGMLLAIHGGKKWDERGALWIKERWDGLHDHGETGILGACVIRKQPVRPEEIQDSKWAIGPWCYILEDRVSFPWIVDIPGKQGLWVLDPKTEILVRQQWAKGLQEITDDRELPPIPQPVGTLF